MQVIYTGNYRSPAVSYRGESFVKGKPTEVSEKWYELNKGGSIKLSKPKAKPKVKVSDNND